MAVVCILTLQMPVTNQCISFLKMQKSFCKLRMITFSSLGDHKNAQSTRGILRNSKQWTLPY